ncbi:T9SS type A sorting domain-containing protein [bacterium]|nr:T9SS type A sorting domain-containing protein [bacterium]
MRRVLYLVLISSVLGCAHRNQSDSKAGVPPSMEFEMMRTMDPFTKTVPSEKVQRLMLQTAVKSANKSQKIYPNTWSAVNDQFANLAVTQLVYDPNETQTFYFCTGEGWFNADAARGAGVWKSTDGGLNWNQLPSTDTSIFHYCQDMVVHPENSDVYVTTRDNGLMRSQDGGNTWESVLGFDNGAETERAADLEIGADGTIYVSFGIFTRDGIYRSESGNAGEWTKIMNGLPNLNINRIEFATAPSDENRLYAVPVRTSDRKIDSVYRSDDKGDNWYTVSLPGGDRDFAAEQGWYDLILKVDPNNPDVVVAGGLNIWRTVDGGMNWQQLTNGSRHNDDPQFADVHVDQHEVIFINSDTVLFGNDGGIYKCDNFTAEFPTFYDLNTNYNVTQFYSVDISPDADAPFVLGGTQDNGSHMSIDRLNQDFEKVSHADGSFCAIDYENSDIVYTTTQYRRIYRTENGEQDQLTNEELENNNTLFINPICMDVNDPQRIYQGSNRGIWRLDNARTAGREDWVQCTRPLGMVSAMATSVSRPNLLIYGRANSGVPFRVENAHITDENYIPESMDKNDELPASVYLNCVTIDPKDENHVLLVYTNYGVNSVYQTKNSMAEDPTWISCEGNLPDIPIRWVEFVPGSSEQCILATELGIYYTMQLKGDSTVWNKVNQVIPNIRVDMIKFQRNGNRLAAGTHGRGIFELEVEQVGDDLQFNIVEVGPSNVGGRTRTIMPDPNDPTGKRLWAGSVSGGLWVAQNLDSIPKFYNKYFELLVYPNPTSDILRVQFDSDGSLDKRVRVYAMSGALVMDGSYTDNRPTLEVDLSELAPGIYILEAIQGDQKQVKKIIVE